MCIDVQCGRSKLQWKSYKLENATVRSYNPTKFISLGENCMVEEIEDIRNVVNDDVDPEGGIERTKVIKGDIIGIIGSVDTL